MNILFIGEYFPKISRKTFRNYQLVKALIKEKCNQVYLLSDSWCDVKENEYIRVNEEMFDDFKEKYFIDPIQIVYSNITIALLGIAIKICKYNKIDFIYTSDYQKYGPVVELIRSYVNVPVIYGLYQDDVLYSYDEIYTKSWLSKSACNCDLVLTHGEYVDILKKNTSFRNINAFHPYVIEQSNLNIENNILILGEIHKSVDVNKMYLEIEKESKGYNVTFLIWGDEKEKILSFFDKSKKMYSVVNLDNFSDMLRKCTGKFVVTTEYLLNNYISFDMLQLLLSFNLYPIINDDYSLLKTNIFNYSIIEEGKIAITGLKNNKNERNINELLEERAWEY